MKYVAFVLVSLVLVACTEDPAVLPPSNTLSPADRLDSKFSSLSERYGLTGTAYYIQIGEDSVFSGNRGEGMSTVAITSAKTWHYSNFIQTLVASTILQLESEGKIDLNSPLGAYIDDYPNVDPTLRIEDLLRHRTNLAPYLGGTALHRSLLSRRDSVWTVENVLQHHILTPTSNVDYESVTTNYLVLGKVLENIVGKSLDDILSDRFVHPLNLDQTIFPIYGMDPYRLNGVWTNFGQPDVVDVSDMPINSILTVGGGASAMVSVPEEAAKILRHILQGNTTMLEMSARLQSLTPGSSSVVPSEFGDVNVRYGMGLLEVTFDGHTLYGHGGRGIHQTNTFHDPELDLTFSISVNHSHSVNLDLFNTSLAVGMLRELYAIHEELNTN